MSPRQRGRFGQAIEGLLSRSPLDLAATLTLIYFLFKKVALSVWYVQAPLQTIAAAALLIPGAARSRVTWSLITVLVAARIARTPAIVDNHVYLLAYWCLALALARREERAEAATATTTRRLIGLVFAFAVLWKAVLSPDFVSGDFFRVTLLTDQHFRELAVLAGDLDRGDWERNVRTVLEARRDRDTAALHEPDRLRSLALLATWWTLLIELALALAFLVPSSSAFGRWRHGLLLLFAWTTYPFATVAGFGWLLMILGIAQCETERRLTRLLYLVSFFAVLLFEAVPWTYLLNQWLSA